MAFLMYAIFFVGHGSPHRHIVILSPHPELNQTVCIIHKYLATYVSASCV
jgi:hypothetical protein